MVARRDEWLSIDDFLALDRESLDQKYEYRNGRIVAMAGGQCIVGYLSTRRVKPPALALSFIHNLQTEMESEMNPFK